MATYDVTKGSGTATHGTGRSPYLVENVLDIGKINADAGVGAADVIRMIDVPAESVVIYAGFEVLTALTGTSPDIDFGITGGDVDEWVDGNDGSAGYATAAVASPQVVAFASADTLDLLFNTNAATAGVIRSFALMLDTSGLNESSTSKASQDDTAV